MIKTETSIHVFHVGRAVEIGIYNSDHELLATGMGKLGVYNFTDSTHAVWFEGTKGDAPDLRWDTSVHYIIVSWDPEGRV